MHLLFSTCTGIHWVLCIYHYRVLCTMAVTIVIIGSKILYGIHWVLCINTTTGWVLCTMTVTIVLIVGSKILYGIHWVLCTNTTTGWVLCTMAVTIVIIGSKNIVWSSCQHTFVIICMHAIELSWVPQLCESSMCACT